MRYFELLLYFTLVLNFLIFALFLGWLENALEVISFYVPICVVIIMPALSVKKLLELVFQVKCAAIQSDIFDLIRHI